MTGSVSSPPCCAAHCMGYLDPLQTSLKYLPEHCLLSSEDRGDGNDKYALYLQFRFCVVPSIISHFLPESLFNMVSFKYLAVMACNTVTIVTAGPNTGNWGATCRDYYGSGNNFQNHDRVITDLRNACYGWSGNRGAFQDVSTALYALVCQKPFS